MALIKIYDADGVEFEKEHIDARECVDGGLFTYEKLDDSIVKAKLKESFKEAIITEQKEADKIAAVEELKAEALAEVKSNLGRPKKDNV